MSTLIISNQMQREEAVEILESEVYNEHDLEMDIKYFLKKMKWSLNDLNDYLKRPEVKHDAYKSEREVYFKLLNFYKKVR